MTDPRDNLPLNRRVLDQVSAMAAEQVNGAVEQFMLEPRSRHLPTAVRQNLRDHAARFDELLQDEVQLAIQMAPRAANRKDWAKMVTDGERLTTFGDLKARLDASRRNIVRQLHDDETLHPETADAVAGIYDEALAMVRVAIDRAQNPVGKAEQWAQRKGGLHESR